jgi:hypothetical protein
MNRLADSGDAIFRKNDDLSPVLFRIGDDLATEAVNRAQVGGDRAMMRTDALQPIIEVG